jgi:hypothetical protein
MRPAPAARAAFHHRAVPGHPGAELRPGHEQHHRRAGERRRQGVGPVELGPAHVDAAPARSAMVSTRRPVATTFSAGTPRLSSDSTTSRPRCPVAPVTTIAMFAPFSVGR